VKNTPRDDTGSRGQAAGRHSHLEKQRGAAIITALFVTALVAASAVAIFVQLRIDTRRTELLTRHTQTYFYADQTVLWAKNLLINNWKQKQPDQLIDKLPANTNFPTDGTTEITAELTDAQGLFNLNDLIDEKYNDVFLQLLKRIIPEMAPNDANSLLLATRAWILPGNTFDDYYAKQTPSYRAAHRLFSSASEFRLVRGVTAALYTKLLPFLTALPETTAININSAPEIILMSLSPTLTAAAAAKSIVTQARSIPFATTNDFLNFDIVKNNAFPSNKITTTSSYFLLKTNVKVGNDSRVIYTLLQRASKDNNVIVVALWQSMDTL